MQCCSREIQAEISRGNLILENISPPQSIWDLFVRIRYVIFVLVLTDMQITFVSWDMSNFARILTISSGSDCHSKFDAIALYYYTNDTLYKIHREIKRLEKLTEMFYPKYSETYFFFVNLTLEVLDIFNSSLILYQYKLNDSYRVIYFELGKVEIQIENFFMPFNLFIK